MTRARQPVELAWDVGPQGPRLPPHWSVKWVPWGAATALGLLAWVLWPVPEPWGWVVSVVGCVVGYVVGIVITAPPPAAPLGPRRVSLGDQLEVIGSAQIFRAPWSQVRAGHVDDWRVLRVDGALVAAIPGNVWTAEAQQRLEQGLSGQLSCGEGHAPQGYDELRFVVHDGPGFRLRMGFAGVLQHVGVYAGFSIIAGGGLLASRFLPLVLGAIVGLVGFGAAVCLLWLGLLLFRGLFVRGRSLQVACGTQGVWWRTDEGVTSQVPWTAVLSVVPGPRGGVFIVLPTGIAFPLATADPEALIDRWTSARTSSSAR